MPVVTADGIVGKLKDVFDHKSLVVLISDPTSGVGVMLETTRTRGILKGSSFGQLQVINVSPDERIKAGERIVTSGGDQIFPRGMPVGTVERVMPDPERDPLVDVAIRPAANLARLEEVLVITDLGDAISPQAQKDLAESEAEGAAEEKRASDILSERLPGRLDAKAPADTNPDPKVGETAGVNTADEVRLMTPPKPLHSDQYSPESTPPSSELTPGQRRAPVLQGSEDVVSQKKPVAATASGASATDSGGNGAAVKKPTTAGYTTAAGSTTASGAGSGAASGAAVAKPVKAANGTTTTGASSLSSASSKPLTTSASGSTAGNSAAAAPPKTKVIVDGPIPGGRTAENRAIDGTSSPRTNTGTSSTGTTGTGTAGATTTAPAKKKGPELVPDDGSRPPTEKPAAPKPKPSVQPSGNSQPAQPNGGR
jgi:rod shape-determining protein MreC